jgi:hypothetical protein
MNQPYQIMLDVWEGQQNIDELQTLAAGGVAGLQIRINDTIGGLHRDEGFDKQWAEAAIFPVRVPYFVYSPWNSGQANYDWLNANMPSDCPAVSIDTELTRTGYAPGAYAADYAQFIGLCKFRWAMDIYTGGWFKDRLAYWPTDIPYWWSQYPYAGYPGYAGQAWNDLPRVSIGWAQLHQLIAAIPQQPMNTSQCPGEIGMWQWTGDKLILPGMSRAVDVSVRPGSLEQLKAYYHIDGSTPPPVVPPTPTPMRQVIYVAGGTCCNVRSEAGSGTILYTISNGTEVQLEMIGGERRVVYGYYRIISPAQYVGWVYSRFVKDEPAEAAPVYKTCPTCGGRGQVLA